MNKNISEEIFNVISHKELRKKIVHQDNSSRVKYQKDIEKKIALWREDLSNNTNVITMDIC